MTIIKALVFLTLSALLVSAVEWDDYKVLGKGKAKLSWKNEEDCIRIKFQAVTDGWIGIGWDPTDGGMRNADVILVGKEGDDYVVYDCFSTGYVLPTCDEQQDIQVVSVGHGTDTYVEFKRAYSTGDESDKDIISGPMTVIWAYGEEIGDVRSLPYHYSTRGHTELTLVSDKKERKHQYDE
eukprot:TRINITY_DN1350_c0_g1_i1.p1 TRINITY_DN1350_c0_g1~~TRINITY_DN1350_c0_g1_i1.p1  ORF type:complete len:181 (-),score=20.42 TRINITY_DN1350_c0_g1_i1:70-612(-)